MGSYLPTTRLIAAVEVRPSPIAGFGVFAREPIAALQPIMEWGGGVGFDRSLFEQVSIITLNDGRLMGDPVGSPTLDCYLNHTCDSNAGMGSDVLVVARRAIAPGEEITLDYALFRGDGWSWGEDVVVECACFLPCCRKRITQHDYLLPAVVEQYRGFFAPYLIRDRLHHERRSWNLV